MSIFALNITPYITSSIIMQLLTIAIPKLEEMQRDGEEGRKKMVALTRYVTIVLGIDSVYSNDNRFLPWWISHRPECLLAVIDGYYRT